MKQKLYVHFYLISYYLLAGVIVTLPFSIRYCSIFIILFCIASLVKVDLKIRLKALFSDKIFLLSTAFFLYHIVALLWTANLKDGGFDIEKKLSILILPLFIGINNYSARRVNMLLLIFCGSVLVFISTSLFFAGLNYLKFGDIAYLLSDQLSSIIGIHRGYLSIYLLFSMNILIFFMVKRQVFNSLPSKVLVLFVLIVLLIGFILLIYRITFIVCFLTLLITALYLILKYKKYLVGLTVIISGLAGAYLLMQVPQINKYISQIYTDLDKGKTEMNMTGPNQRLVKWKAALEVIKKNPIMGVGTGDVDDELYKRYLADDFFWGIKHRYNSHNQYLQTYLGLGIVGFFLLIFLLYFSSKEAAKNVNYISLLFLLMIAFVFLTECILSNQKGVVFFCLFNTLLNIRLNLSDSKANQDLLLKDVS